MRLTRRGYGLVAVVVAAEAFALTYGGATLNAVVAPLVIALLVAAVHVRRTATPTVDRASVSPGFPGDTREVTVMVDGSGVAALVDAVPDGLAAAHAWTETTLPAELSYELTLNARGRHALGPVSVTVTDVLGLVTETYETPKTTNALVYPPVYQLAGRERILRDVLDRDAVERQEFDSLREYAPGDPLRNVHWKSTAKDPDGMYVTEFADRRIEDSVVLAASCEEGYADEMAAAAASVAVLALDVDVAVELRTPSGRVPAGSGVDHRDEVLKLLAITDGGRPAEAAMDDVDMHVHAAADGVTLSVGTRDHEFDEMTVTRTNPLADREVTA